MSKILSADSKKIQIRAFEACLGVTLEINNPSKFIEEYQNYFEKIKSDYNFKTSRNVFKSHDLKKFVHDVAVANEIVDKFVKEVVTPNCKVNVVFASFSPRKIKNSVRLYIKDRRKKYNPKKL